MSLPLAVPLSGESDGRPQVKGSVLRVRRSSRAPGQDQDESFICFYLVFQAWIWGSQLVDGEAKKGPLRADGAEGGEGGRFQ